MRVFVRIKFVVLSAMTTFRLCAFLKTDTKQCQVHNILTGDTASTGLKNPKVTVFQKVLHLTLVYSLLFGPVCLDFVTFVHKLRLALANQVLCFSAGDQ